MPALYGGRYAERKEQQLKHNPCKQSMRDPDCMGGRDFRDQNDAKRETKSKAMGGRKGELKCEHCIGEHARREKNSRWNSIEAERVIKAKQDSDCMGGHDFRSQNAAEKGRKAGLFDAEMEGLSASIAWGNTRGAQQTEHEGG